MPISLVTIAAQYGDKLLGLSWVWAVLEVSRVLADAFGMPFEWPADISRNNMEITWDREVGQRAASPPTLDPACVSLDYSSDVAPLSPFTPQKFQNWATWSPQQRSPCSEPHSPGPFAVAPTPGCAAGAPASLTGVGCLQMVG